MGIKVNTHIKSLLKQIIYLNLIFIYNIYKILIKLIIRNN